jgi:hypothetical protein
MNVIIIIIIIIITTTTTKIYFGPSAPQLLPVCQLESDLYLHCTRNEMLKILGRRICIIIAHPDSRVATDLSQRLIMESMGK